MADVDGRPLRSGKVVNAPVVTNSGGYENRVTYSKVLADKTAGTNTSMAAYAFEARCAQEQGTH